MVFDPLFIIYQIIALQCAFYVAMGTIWGVCHVVFENPISLDHFFTSKHISFVSIGGWIDILCTFISAIIGSYLLYIIVERSKKCVDFTFTLYFVHIMACTFYYQFPLEWEWWLTMVLSSVAMATLGEYLCVRAELEDIPLYSNT